MNETFLDELATCLRAYGVRGEAAERVLAEARDHLREASVGGEGEAVRRFGPVDGIARMIAAELATAGTRSAAFITFGALALAGLGYIAVFMLLPAAGESPDIFDGRVAAVGPLAGLAMILLPQIAFVSGCLALVRALGLRRAPASADAELRLLRRRSGVAIAAGAGTLVAVVVYAANLNGVLAGWWTWTTVALCGMLVLPLALAASSVARSAAPSAVPGGRPGDVFDDLAPLFQFAPVRRLELPEHPWWFAASCAAAVGILGFAGGWYGEGDPGPGLVRGGFEALALLICFATLGRPLGLRR